MAEREGARQSSIPIVVCTAPDICKTPVGNSTPPIPYQIIANFQDSDAVSPNVRFGGDPAFLLDRSIITRVTGDEPGTAGGVRSGVNKSIARPIEASTTVRANKKRVVRDKDAFEMNSGNTSGICIYQPGSGPACKSGADGRPTGNTNPPTRPNTPAEMEAANEGKGMWGKASPIVHGILGAASFIPGLSAVTGALDAGIYAGEGSFDDAVMAGLGMFPGGKAATTAGKLAKGAVNAGRLAKTLKKAEASGKEIKAVEEAAGRATKNTIERVAKDKVEKGAAEKAAAPKGTDGVIVHKRRFPPNSAFEHNGYFYKTDAQGRVIEVSGELKLDKAPRNNYAQRMAGVDDGRLATDQGGHLIGSRFGGTGKPINLVSMDARVNSSSLASGEWGKMESRWADELRQGNKVEVTINPVYKSDTARPDLFAISEKINGKIVETRIFNRAGG